MKLKGKRDPNTSLLVANYVSPLDSLAASHTLGTITVSIKDLYIHIKIYKEYAGDNNCVWPFNYIHKKQFV